MLKETFSAKMFMYETLKLYIKIPRVKNVENFWEFETS